jgi:Tautomerase enzyme
MPLVRIEMIKGRPLAERRRLLGAAHAALVDAFGIPDDDRTQGIVEHDPENFDVPPGAGDHYTLIEITAFPGRSETAKHRLYEASFAPWAPPASLLMTSRSFFLNHRWRTGASEAGDQRSEVDLGFQVDV